MEYIDTLEFHKNNPGESVEKYLKRKRVELSRSFHSSKKIYLDTKYWILLRDARIRNSVDNDARKLLHLIENLVDSGQIICPISDTIFSEIQKQTDADTLKATAQIIDDLSKGVSIINSFERLDLETIYFIRSKTTDNDSIYSLDEMVWTKIAYVMGFLTPSSDSIPPDIDCAMQKAFIDQMWGLTLTDMLDQIHSDSDSYKPDFLDSSQKLNEGKYAHSGEHKSFKQTFLAELAGMLEFYKPSIQSLWIYLYESEIGRKITPDESSLDKASQMFANLVYHAFRLNKLSSELPSFHISAGIHAAVRWDKQRNYKPNDLYDFLHAVAAIPYYDYFLTENSLGHLLCCNNLRFNTVYRCKTISDINTAINELSQILLEYS